jgi:hypothetical protein
MRDIIILIFTGCILFGCASRSDCQETIVCTDSVCKGVYEGPEFIGSSDVAHQFSNHMSKSVGDKLKELYKDRKYSKVDLLNIKMTTKDMNQIGNVIYTLEIPFIPVKDSCDAFTSFDHRGGWGHKRDSLDVVREFRNVDNLKIIELSTPEGLQEFWAQWRHKSYQIKCK